MFNKSNNSWIELYKKQRGLCTVCKEPLGYLKEEALEIHHIIPVSKWVNNVELNKISNLRLIHKMCHKMIHVSK